MENKKNALWAFVDAFGVFIYVALIATIMSNGNKIFGEKDTFLTPIAVLLLFVLSATITGALVLGRPVWLYLANFKKDSVLLFVYTVGWLFVLTFLTFLAMFAFNYIK